MTDLFTVPDMLNVSISTPSSVLVASDIHLAARHTKASRNVERYLTERITELAQREEAIVVLNGDIFELWAGQEPTVEKALLAHNKLARAWQDFASQTNHRVVLVIGNHDGKLGWDKSSQKTLQQIGIELCFRLELNIKTLKNTKKIVFEHGHQLDPENAFADPRNPHDKPFGQYIVQKALPMVHASQGQLLADINYLSEPYRFPKFVASRVFYREILSRLWWLLVPVAIIFVARVLIGYEILVTTGYTAAYIARVLLYVELAVLLTVLVIIAAMGLILSRVLRRARPIPGGAHGKHHNAPARHKAQQLIEDKQAWGYVTGHTHRPELRHIENGFYANSGSGTEMVDAAKTRFGLPNTYMSLNHLHWLELDFSDSQLTITHYQMLEDNGKQTLLERLATKHRRTTSPLHQHQEIVVGF